MMEQSSESSHQCEMDLLALPDLVLLEVLKLLDVGSLLRCRQVCRRLCALALHAYVWSHRHVKSGSGLRVALRLAPCVRVLDIRGLDDTEREELLSPNSCAAETLSVAVKSAADAALVASVLHHQVRLGHLQSFNCIVVTKFDSPVVVDLGNAIVDISGHLRRLALTIFPGSCLASSCTTGVTAPSLQSFEFTAFCREEESAITLEKLLTIHSPTLKHIIICISKDLGLQGRWPAQLKFPQLKTLECTPLDGMDSLLESRSLTSLSLYLKGLQYGSPCAAALASAGRLLRLAALEKVRITFGRGRAQQDLNLVQILGRSERSVLRQLVLYCKEEDAAGSSRLCEFVAAALPGLPCLEGLHLYTWGADLYSKQRLMQAIRPHTSPRLTKFSWGDVVDAAAFMFKESVQEMLKANPKLEFCEV